MFTIDNHGPKEAHALPNLGLLCWHHHDLVHCHGAHTLRTDPNGDWCLPGCTPAAAA